jgi:hypothetical protein
VESGHGKEASKIAANSINIQAQNVNGALQQNLSRTGVDSGANCNLDCRRFEIPSVRVLELHTLIKRDGKKYNCRFEMVVLITLCDRFQGTYRDPKLYSHILGF